MIAGVLKTARKILTEQLALGVVLFVFFASRAVYFLLLGVRLDATPLLYFWQIVDPKLLQEHLLQSLYYLHSQPPLFNLFLGTVLKIFPGSYEAAFSLIYMAIGAFMVTAVYGLMTALGVRRRLSAALTCLFAISPLVVDYENWLFYEYPTAGLLCGAAFFLQRFTARKKTLDCFVFFMILAVILCFRGLFNLSWFLFVAAVMLAVYRAQWRKVARGVVLPLLLILALYLKQFMVFGVVSTGDALLGVNLGVAVTGALPDETVKPLIDRGKISGFNRTEIITLDPPILAASGITLKRTGIPVLDMVRKATGAVNMHHLIHLEIGKQKIRDALYALEHYPGIIFPRLARAFAGGYFLTNDQCRPYVANRTPGWETWRKVYKRFFLGADARGKSPLLALGLPLLLLYGLFSIYRSFCPKEPRRALGMVLLFMVSTIFFLAAVTLFSWGDWSRYRFLVDPFYLVLFGLFLNEAMAAGVSVKGSRSV